jgi:hypothetical protein
MTNQNINVALIGNPNTGKTSVFQLTLDWISKWGIIPELRLKKDWILQIPIMPKLIFWTYPNIQLKCHYWWKCSHWIATKKNDNYIQTLHLLLQM